MNKIVLLFIIALILISCSNPVGDTNHQVASLNGNYPNPFNPTTTISFSVKEACHVRITIYNDLEQVVKTLIDENLMAGHHHVVWNGTDDAGNPVTTGVYYYELLAGDYCAIKEMLLLK